MRPKFEDREILLTDLLVNPENPRFEPVAGQREAIFKIIENQGDKIVRLADDITREGLSPLKTVVVSVDSSDNTKFIVLEGNRRVTALKLLHAPEIADGKYSHIIGSKFRSIVNQFKADPINSVKCAVFQNKDDANKWIRLEHTGENEGIGTARWDAQQVARFDEKVKGKSSISLQVLDFLRNSISFDQDLKQKLPEINISTLERLIGDAKVKSFLGLSIKQGRLYSELDQSEILKGLTKVISDLTKGLTARTIDKKQDRQAYLNTFDPAETPNLGIKTIDKWELINPPKLSLVPNNKQPKKVTANSAGQSGKMAPLSTDREYLAPNSPKLTIKDVRINKIYTELRTLKVLGFENAVSVIFRVFLELSVDAYISHKKIQGIKKMDSLKIKVSAVINHMKDSLKTDDHLLKGINTSVSTDDDLVSIDTFNSYVHNRHFSPDPTHLKRSWDNLQPFIETIWANIG